MSGKSKKGKEKNKKRLRRKERSKGMRNANTSGCVRANKEVRAAE